MCEHLLPELWHEVSPHAVVDIDTPRSVCFIHTKLGACQVGIRASNEEGPCNPSNLTTSTSIQAKLQLNFIIMKVAVFGTRKVSAHCMDNSCELF